MSVILSTKDIDAVIFDLDGVVTKTATTHSKSWKQLFDEYLKQKAEKENTPFVPFEEKDYLEYVDGKPRYEGVKSFLESRGIQLDYGTHEDSADKETICGLGNKKNFFFNEELRKHGVEVYPTTVELINDLRAQGIKTAIISSSKNCKPILESVNLLGHFDAKIDGVDALERGIPGKPAPDVFVTAAKDIGVSPSRAAVVEDAISGVQAGSAGDFKIVIGVDRAGQRQQLLDNGATIVVDDLGEVAVAGKKKPNALENKSHLDKLIHRKEIAIFLDYDGTLTPIVSKPELAVLDPSMKKTLEKLASSSMTVAIISGRDRENVLDKVQVEGLYYSGSHGFDTTGPNGLHYEYEEGENFLAELDNAEKALQEKIGSIQGALVERKKYAIAIHYRLVDQKEVSTIEAAVDAINEEHPRLRKTGGKMIFELRPDIPWDKGKAVHWLLKLLKLDHKGVLPIYIGDDVTDEDAFAALEYQGLGVVVQEEVAPTAAHYTLHNTDEVQELLEHLLNVEQGVRS